MFEALLESLPDDHHTREALVGDGYTSSTLSDYQAQQIAQDYARKDWLSCAEKLRPRLLHAATCNKDQSYLSSITEGGLRRTLFPLGHLNKPQVRELTQKYRLQTAKWPESLGFCFVGVETGIGDFICKLDLSFAVHSNLPATYIPLKPAPIYELSTRKVIGKHTGLWNYTIGGNVRIRQLECFLSKEY